MKKQGKAKRNLGSSIGYWLFWDKIDHSSLTRNISRLAASPSSINLKYSIAMYSHPEFINKSSEVRREIGLKKPLKYPFFDKYGVKRFIKYQASDALSKLQMSIWQDLLKYKINIDSQIILELRSFFRYMKFDPEYWLIPFLSWTLYGFLPVPATNTALSLFDITELTDALKMENPELYSVYSNIFITLNKGDMMDLVLREFASKYPIIVIKNKITKQRLREFVEENGERIEKISERLFPIHLENVDLDGFAVGCWVLRQRWLKKSWSEIEKQIEKFGEMHEKLMQTDEEKTLFNLDFILNLERIELQKLMNRARKYLSTIAPVIE